MFDSLYHIPYCVPSIYSMVAGLFMKSKGIIVAQYFVSTSNHFLLNSVWQKCPFIVRQSVFDRMFNCLNINCYQRFGTERGLRSHLWRSTPCQEYMSRARKIDGSVETVSTSRLVGYGVESTRLNFDMNTDVPLYGPYGDFQCFATNGVDDLTDKDHQVEEDDYGLNDVDDVPNTNPYHELQAPSDSDNTGIQDVFLSALEGFMERMKSRDHYTIKILQHDVEHRSIINLLKIWRTANVPTTCCSRFLNGHTIPRWMVLISTPKPRRGKPTSRGCIRL